MVIVVTRQPSPNLHRCQLSHIPPQPIDIGKALEQHQEFEHTLEAMQALVHRLPDAPQDARGVFVGDAAVIAPQVAICASSCFDPQQSEIVAAPMMAIARFRDVVPFADPATFEGSDMIVTERDVLVGQTARTNRAALDQMRLLMETELATHRVRPARVNGCRNLKSGCSYIGRDTVVVNRRWIDGKALSGYRCIDVAPEEPFGANTLTVHGTVIVPASSPRTAEAIDKAGFSVLTLDVSEFEKAEGGLSSLCLLFTAIESLMACHT
jgi:dimethylargininase